MQYRKLGRTGVEVSRLCLGCMMFGGEEKLDADCRVIDRAVEAGVNFLDTANVYGRGKSETTVGQALKRRGDRDEIFLATKVHGRMKDGEHQPNRFGNNRRMIIEECHNSLRRLQTDYIDLYQIHRPQSDVPIDETLRALDDLVRQGKVRYLGFSTFPAWKTVEALWVSDSLNLNRVVCEQPPYHLLDRRVERELLPMARTYGLGVIPWSPLAGGFLTGKYRRDAAPPTDARIQPGKGRGDLMLGNERAHAVVDVLERIAAELGDAVTITQVALAWCRDQPGVTSPIVGPKNLEQLEDNLASEAIELTDAHRAALDEAAPPGDVIVPYYNADFAPPVHRFR